MNGMTNQIKPWDRQVEESEKAYEAFVIYRDLGKDRGVQIVATELSKSRSLITRWARDHNWHERIAEFDSYVSSELDKQYITKAKEVYKEHLELLEKSRKSLMAVITTLSNKLETDGLEELKEWSLEKLFEYLRVCLPRMEQVIKLERLLRGISTYHLEVTGSSHEDTEERYYVDKEAFELFSSAIEDVYAERSKNKTALEVKPNSEISRKSKH